MRMSVAARAKNENDENHLQSSHHEGNIKGNPPFHRVWIRLRLPPCDDAAGLFRIDLAFGGKLLASTTGL